MRKRWLIAVSAAAVLLVLAVPAASAAPGARPFKAAFSGEVHWEWPGSHASDCDEVTTVTEAVGRATHLGNVAISSSHCPAEPANVEDGRATFVAANGDELYGVYDYDPLSESNEITFSFDGGTGRFAGASGEAVWTYWLTPVLVPGCTDPTDFACLDLTVPWEWWSTLVGTLEY